MRFALCHKFKQGTSWGKKLMDYDKEIVEWNNWADVFWGKSIYNGEGRNELGKILMEIRYDLKRKN